MLNKCITKIHIFHKSIITYRFTTQKQFNDSIIQFKNALQKNSAQSLKQAAQLFVNLQKQIKLHQLRKKELAYQLERTKKQYVDHQSKLEIAKTNLDKQNQQLEFIKKRTENEVQNASAYSIAEMAKQIIEVADSIKKCCQLIKDNTIQSHIFKNGVQQSNKILMDQFNKFSIKQFDPVGQIYDPNTQESISQKSDPSKPNNSVANTILTGYTIKNRLLRSAKVCIYRN